MKRVQCQPGTDEINHDVRRFPVSPLSWQVSLPDDVAAFMVADGRSGIYVIGDALTPELNDHNVPALRRHFPKGRLKWSLPSRRPSMSAWS